MASPQLENGYTRIANELLEQFAMTNLSGYEWQVLFVIIRKTYGYNKKQDSIALSQLSLLTGIKNSHIPAVLKKLKIKNIIKIDKEHYINRYSLNKEYTYKYSLSEIKLLPKRGGKLLPKRGVTKERKKTTKERAFSKPKISEINQYIEDNGYGVDGEAWLAFYESNGWKVGKNPMRSWKGAITTWEKRNNPTKKTTIKEKVDELYKQGKKRLNEYSLTTIKTDLNDLEPGEYSDETKRFLNDKELITKICAK